MVSLFPEEIIQRLIQRLADTDAELNGRIVISLFNRIDGLAANPNRIRELLLGFRRLGVECPYPQMDIHTK